MSGTKKHNNTEIIVSGIGRCGTTLVSNLIGKATKRRVRYIADIRKSKGIIKKTHSHYHSKYSDVMKTHKTIYMSGNIGDSIASLYRIGSIIFALAHAIHLQVKLKHLLTFCFLHVKNKDSAYLYLIEQDKFRLKENISTWKKRSNTLYINYEELCTKKEQTLKEISNFLEVDLPDFEVRQRKSSINNLPESMQDAIKSEYYSKDLSR